MKKNKIFNKNKKFYLYKNLYKNQKNKIFFYFAKQKPKPNQPKTISITNFINL